MKTTILIVATIATLLVIEGCGTKEPIDPERNVTKIEETVYSGRDVAEIQACEDSAKVDRVCSCGRVLRNGQLMHRGTLTARNNGDPIFYACDNPVHEAIRAESVPDDTRGVIYAKGEDGVYHTVSARHFTEYWTIPNVKPLD